jgi:hypothetical protein
MNVAARFARGFGAALFAAVVLAAPGAARELSWNAIDVRARLDADGTLHVVETQAMVFTGDWNGGERRFRVAPGQVLNLESITRIAPDGSRKLLTQGGLSAVDEWSWAEENVLRWRSRLPSQPEFAGTEIVYEIAYSLARILQKEGSRYVLDHNFGLPDAEYPIRRLTVELELDPVWKPMERFTGRYSAGALPPGSDFTVTVPLTYTGSGNPAATAVASPRLRQGLLGVLAAAIVYCYLAWRRRDGALGRLAPLTPAAAIDEAWLEKNLLTLAPEEAGALWDEKIGPPEVAAVLACLASEKKIATHVEAVGKKLSMRLLVPVSQLKGYDQDLVEALFFGGRKETDTDAIKAHYKSRGFDPTSKIKPGLEAKLKTLPDFQDKSGGAWRWPAAALLLAGLACHAYALVTGRAEPGLLVGTAITYGLLYGIGLGCAYAFRNKIVRIDAWSILFLWAPALLLFFAWLGVREAARLPLAVVLGSMFLRLAIVVSLFHMAWTRNGPRRIARRKQLASARAYFGHELDEPAPRLKDEWFPYVVAFGLTSEADSWFRAHGAAVAAGAAVGSGSSRGSSSSSSSSPSPGGGGWTGGGGSFGGAGASASWAVAAGALASGVSAPSSSSSGGGGGGGGGGSSGGGGGGGW